MSESVAQSVLDRLLNLSRKNREDYNLVLTRYGIERLLYRLSQTKHADRFVLKGAMLFMLWMNQDYRPTRDIDLLGFGEIDQRMLSDIFREICQVSTVDDGVVFQADSIKVEEIREGEIYQGQRVKIRGNIGNTRLAMQVDVGFGDVIVPEPTEQIFPILLDYPAPRIRIYSRESVIAEKLDAIIVLGLRNSRMKDYYDLWTLVCNFEFGSKTLIEAIRATLVKRGRKLPESLPAGLGEQFAADSSKRTQWKAFIERAIPGRPVLELADVFHRLREFLEIPLCALTGDSFADWHWPPAGPWKKTD
ncbi:nucleotidyl transferase AbiEii/AbiGii toxin family protein [bacterium]|nr:nucleotidyl transferase AbiEii/AbiGii toxin family protein [bacterium]